TLRGVGIITTAAMRITDDDIRNIVRSFFIGSDLYLGFSVFDMVIAQERVGAKDSPSYIFLLFIIVLRRSRSQVPEDNLSLQLIRFLPFLPVAAGKPRLFFRFL